MLQVEEIDLFYGGSQALKSVSVSAEIGAVTAVMGRNGVGKTSLLNAIMGQHPVRRGRILWDGKDITRSGPSQRARRGIAIVPQGREIFPLLSVEENLQTGYSALPRGERRISDEIYDLFPVLKDMMRRRGGDLSGGQQQQLAIARALVMKPRLLLLDEPTEGIQPSIIKDIERVIEWLAGRGDMAIILVEQYFEFAKRLATTYTVLDRGEVQIAGTADSMDEAHVRSHLTV